MADTDRTDRDAKGQLFDQLDDIHAGMLGVIGSGQHYQPMAPYMDRDAGQIWFITSRETDLAHAANVGADAHFNVTGKDHDYHACLKGTLRPVVNPAKLDEVWSRVAAAFFDGGKDDPNILLLCLDLQDAAIWSSTGSGVVFALEILRANLSETHRPDIGTHRVVSWDKAA
ncbi:pyridoxamine 5'-phosphate oxidase family protein [Actibacterium sp. 188UL27-1]|uniref:pyridoxamine 5'-phosphate oxidase family protein n=1 Tax=Actibacterium sp. 188UL27-1 TaxID=2786961 RepID=UPI00195EFCC4|nr:pyridoxamine 5'-phosphate oxidase family protein [Actibacterium sp. 188UL27-1]MBM7068104.1 pyridoxamine 5'-phosphate oxidase family protein [Actibacterium sp. 188UL27-1]